MNIFLLERDEPCGYDELCSIVVLASCERNARAVAAARAGDEGPDVWFMPERVKCTCAGTARLNDVGFTPRALCRDFNAG